MLTPKFIVSYPNVFKPTTDDYGNTYYDVMAIFPKGTDLSALKKAAEEALIEKFGENKKKWPDDLTSPFRKHSERAEKDDDGNFVYYPPFEEGGFFVNLKTKQKPGIVNQKLEDIISPEEFYAGCWARASVNVFAYSHKKGKKGAAIWLNNLQKVAEGEPLGSRKPANLEFAPIESEEDKKSSESSVDLFS